jgi:hypothetical protein
MMRNLSSRLKTLEAKVPDQTRPPKAILPAWLIERLRQQGIRVERAGLRNVSITGVDGAPRSVGDPNSSRSLKS